MLRSTLAQAKHARMLFGSILLATTGQGLVLPFLFIYLTHVRHLDPTWVGAIGAWIGIAGLVVAGPAGALVDRFGSRRVFVILALLEACGLASYALVHSVWQAFLAATVASAGGPAVIGAFNTLLATATPEEVRQRFFGVTFVGLNVGIGLGGLIGGAIADVGHPGSFEVLYAIAGVTGIVAALMIVGLRDIGDLVPADPSVPAHGGYRTLLQDRVFLRFLVVGILLMSCAYGQLEYGFTAFAADVAHVSTHVVGWAFAANCTTIVVIQLLVLPHIEGRSRSRLLALAATVILSSWAVLATGAIGGGGGGAAIASVVACGVVFALGEVVMSPVMSALTNSLATDVLRGRYNTVASMTFGVTSVIGPLTAAPLIGHSLWGVWFGLVVAFGACAAMGAMTLIHRLTPEQDGLVTSSVAAAGGSRTDR
ncbi:MAG TPA: MFS transporter [Mycobacteriales bacterium]|nr:MFS transporter [Mycobacteriales bacterium]